MMHDTTGTYSIDTDIVSPKSDGKTMRYVPRKPTPGKFGRYITMEHITKGTRKNMQTYITRPDIEIQAEQWDGTDKHARSLSLNTSIDKIAFTTIYGVDTLEGFMEATEGDYIVVGTEGERYPCKPEAFEKKHVLKTEGSV